jgi:tRNA threonylcarbamoyl adenosine modification protein YeaZ
MKILALDFSSPQRSVAVLNSGAFTAAVAPVCARPRALRDGITGSPGKSNTARETGLAAPGDGRTPTEGEGAAEIVNVSTGRQVSEVIETSASNTMRPFAMIETALADANIERHEIECVVVGLGPGSYTGIRAGIAMAQGWQLAREVKLLGISSVEAIAAQAQADGMRGAVNVVVDAQRDEFYLATWELADAGLRETEALHIASRETIQARADADEPVIGPEVSRWFAAGKIAFPRAAMLAQIAALRTDFVSGEALEPIYLRETTFVKAPPPRKV